MSEEYIPKPLQTRRGDLILPPADKNNQVRKRVVSQLAPLKPASRFARIFMVLLIVGCFAAMMQSNVLWTDYDMPVRSAYESMDSWTEAWQHSVIRGNDPITLTSYFLEKKLPLPTPLVHRSINLILHIIAALLLLKCLESLKAPAAYSATLVFALHPAVVQPLFWPGYRPEFLGLVLILSALLAGIRNRGVAGYWAMLFFTAMACTIHPAGIGIPVVLALIIICQKNPLHLHSFNRVLPLICIALLLGVWTQHQAAAPVAGKAPDTLELVEVAGENMFFHIKQAVFPFDLGLFHPMTNDKDYSVGAQMSLLPFFLFLPFYVLAALNWRKRWARPLMLGVTTYLLFVLHGISQTGVFLDNSAAHENHGVYVALPAMIALIICSLGAIVRQMGPFGKPLWSLGFSFFLLVQLAITGSYAYTTGHPVLMWQSMTEQWPESWIPKAALIKSIEETGSDLMTAADKITMLESILAAKPELIEERMMFARIFSKEGQNNNAVREYKRILRETEPGNAFLEEAAAFYDKVGLYWDATNARERIQPE
jgi:hypothetical protein